MIPLLSLTSKYSNNMKLLAFKITSDFRNLNGLNLQFDEANDTYVLIGNNGTGKTNILEALSCVFSTLLSHKTDFLFDFVLRYKIEENVCRVKFVSGLNRVAYEVNDIVVNESEFILPNRVVCNYSGEDDRMWTAYYKKHYDDYMSNIRTADAFDNLRMVYIDKSLWKFILLCMLSARDLNLAYDKFLTEKLNLGRDGLDRIKIDINKEKFSKWKKENQITVFIKQLLARINPEGFLSSTDVDDFNPNDDDARDLFNKYVGAAQVINDIKIFYNQRVEADYLSEGEKKMMVILFILESIADERTLVLMDEPDSHIHISRKAELNTMFKHMEHRSNIITSHSPTLTATFENEAKGAVIMLDRKDDGMIKVINRDIVNLVERLTDGIWSSQKQNLFLASHDDILIVEGPTDETFIRAALKHFQSQGKYNDLSFEFIPCGGASNVKAFVQKFKPKAGQTVMAFFDGDDAGMKSMNAIVSCTLGKGKKWDTTNFGKSRKNRDTWFSFYPPYPRRRDKKNFNVEDYFTCTLFRKYIMSFSSLDTIKGKEGLKNKLDRDCQSGNIPFKFYDKFSTLFDHIRAIKQANANGLTEI